jgi:hypothetical protein
MKAGAGSTCAAASRGCVHANEGLSTFRNDRVASGSQFDSKRGFCMKSEPHLSSTAV